MRASAPDADALRAASSIAVALGGFRNIASSEACALTRVRVKVVDPALVNDAALRQTAVAGVMHVGGNVLHLIVGSKADSIAAAMKSDVQVVAPR